MAITWSSLYNAFVQLKSVYTKVFKSGSVALAILIPITIFLTALDFLPTVSIAIISQLFVYIVVAEAIINIIIAKYEATKARVATLNRNIKTENYEALKQYAEFDTSSYEVLKTELTKMISGITDLVEKKKVAVKETIPDTSEIETPKNIDGSLTSR